MKDRSSETHDRVLTGSADHTNERSFIECIDFAA
jgi:hypothetical protein